MLTFFYNIIIFPIIQIIDLCYVFIYRIFSNSGIAIMGVSVAVSVCTLPLYFVAETFQKKERDLQKKLKPKTDKIKAVFKGDERYLVLSTYYKQNHYHPIYALRNNFGLFIQIPFFIAAYSYISHSESLQGTSFFFIKNLGIPDGLFSFHNIRFNILPVLMTLINIISGMVYAKGLEVKDKIQLYIISVIFLILLYNSPAGLVIYWTMNNILSLGKNILQRVKHPRMILFCILFPGITAIDIFLLFFHKGDLPNRLLAAILVSMVFFLPFIPGIIKSLRKYVPFKDKILNQQFPAYFYILSCIILFLLHGGIIPSSLIASSVEEFSYIDARTTPFPFIFGTLLQSAGIFLFWPLAIYFLFSGKTRRILAFIMFITAGISMINVFLITENFGFLTPTMIFSEPKPFSLIPGIYILNAGIVCLTAAVLFFLLYNNKTRIIASAQIISLIALLGYGIINIKQIFDNFIFVRNQYESRSGDSENFHPRFLFSKSGQNVLLIMLDCAIGSHIPYIFNEKPELNSIMRGFRAYPNCVSFANHTLVGALPIYGGYEYTPAAVNKRKDVPLITKQQEAYLLLPKLFLNAGYSVTITDPPFDNYMMSNLSVFADHPEIRAENLIGKYTKQWLREQQEITTISLASLLDNNLIRFSFFKSAPLFLRIFIYDNGKWLSLTGGSKNQLTDTIINDYAFLDTLDKITAFTDAENTYTALYAHLPHNTAFLQAPDYIPVQQVTDRGSSPLANDGRFHLTTASFLMLGKWFEYLKANSVYDNTRIIIVSDHGRGATNFPGNIWLPNGDVLQSYNALLMEKDFYSEGALAISDDFMTNGDVPSLLLEGLIDNPVNTFTGNLLQADKNNGVTITTIGALSTYRHNKYGYNIGKNQWLYVRDNIFDPDNWKTVLDPP